ncbi:MAG: hypothetical protein DSY32_00255 [Aquifex sp.]|nr:MAG: hypothetical protein DSY32_00255 [Aquifex sp.]
MYKTLLILILLTSLSFSVCPIKVFLMYKTSDKSGKYFRRTDVIVYTNVKVKGERVEDLKADIKVTRGRSVVVEIHPKLDLKEDVLLVIPIKKDFPEVASIEEVEGNVKKVYIAYPVDIGKDLVKFPVPSFKKGKRIKIKLHTQDIGNPYLEKVKSSAEREPLKITYSVYFGYAKVKTKDKNLEHLRRLISKLRNSGLLKRVEFVGLADANSKNPKKNLEVAKKRALFVLKKVLGKEALECVNPRVLR